MGEVKATRLPWIRTSLASVSRVILLKAAFRLQLMNGELRIPTQLGLIRAIALPPSNGFEIKSSAPTAH